MATSGIPIPGAPVTPPVMVAAVVAHATEVGDLAPATLVEFADVMDRFARFVERGLGITDISVVNTADVERFVTSRRADGAPPSLSLKHNRRTVCRYLFRQGRALGLCSTDPASVLDLPPRRRIPPRPLTDDEIEQCRSHALFHPGDLRHPVAWALAEATARTSEITTVAVADVDMDAGAVRLGGSSRSAPRTVAFTDWGFVQVRRRLQAHRTSPSEPLLPMRSRRVPRASASMAVIEVMRAAGIGGADLRPISVVAWRGASAYWAGSSIEEVAALLGLSSLDRTAALIERG